MAIDRTLQPKNYVQYVDSLLPSWFTNDRNQREFFGIVFGLVADTLMQYADECWQLPFVERGFNPDDVLRWVGEGRAIRGVRGETPTQYRSRIKDSWNTHLVGGSGRAIERQIELVGVDDCVATAELANPDHANYGDGSYVFSVGCFFETAEPDVVESFQYADADAPLPSDRQWDEPGLVWGGSISQITTRDKINAIRKLIRTFKAVDWRCLDIVLVTGPNNPFINAYPGGGPNASYDFLTSLDGVDDYVVEVVPAF